MQAVIISTPGAANVLTLVERPSPEMSSGEVLIDVKAAGINRPDVFQRKPPLGRGRDQGPTGGAVPVYHHPELGQ